MEVGRLQRPMRRGRWRGLPRAVVGATLKPRAVQTVVSGRARVQEHHVLRERVVQPLQHGVHQNQEQWQCGRDAIEFSLGLHHKLGLHHSAHW